MFVFMAGSNNFNIILLQIGLHLQAEISFMMSAFSKFYTCLYFNNRINLSLDSISIVQLKYKSR